MTNKSFAKRLLTSGSAMRALALAGAGVATAGVFVAAPVAAQDYTAGAVTGTVTDEAGNPVQGATVTITSNAQGFTRTATTSSNGNFRFNSLPTGTYEILVTGGAFADYQATDVSVLAGQSANLGIRVSAGNEIVVTGSTIVTSFEGTTTGLNVDVEELTKRVPLPRDLTSVVLLAPGTTEGDSAFGNLASIGGSSVAENAYYLNGLNITNFDNYLGSARVPFDFYRSVEVKSGGYSAEYGRATGGIVNAVTKSGSNEFFGGIHLDYSPNELRSDGEDLLNCTYNVASDPSGGTSCDPLTNRAADFSESYSAVVEAGLPIIKDRLFVYGLVEFRESESITINRNTGLATRDIQDDPFWGAKVDAYPIDSQHLEFTIFDTRRTTNRSTAPYTETGDEYSIGAYAETANFNFGGLNYVGKYTGSFTDWLTVSAAYGVMEDRFDNVALGSAAAQPAFVNFSGSTVEGVPDGGLYTDQTVTSTTVPYETRREFYRGDVDLFFEAAGEHHVRVGFDVEETTLARATVYNGGGYLQANNLITDAAFNAGVGGAGIYFIVFPGTRSDNTSGLVVDQIYFNSGGTFDGVNRAFYIQDEWKVTDRLTLNLGLRRDDFSINKADGSDFLDLEDNYAPRLGAELNLWDDYSGKLYAFYGQYFLPVASNTAFRAAGAEFQFRERFDFEGLQQIGGVTQPIFGDQVTGAVDSRYGNACPFALNPNAAGGNTCRVTGDGSVQPSDAFFGENLKATKQSEFIVGYEHDFGEFRAGISFTHRNLDRTAEDAAIDAAVLAYCDEQGITGCDDVWTGFHQYVTYNIGGPLTVSLFGDDSATSEPLDGKVVTFTPGQLGYPAATRSYDALEITFDRPWDGTWQLGGSYTLSEAFGNSEGYVQSDFGQDDAGITQDFDQPGFTDYATGLLPNHRAHRLRVFGALAPIENFTVGGNLSVESPRPLSCFGYHPTDVFALAYGAASRFCGLEPVVRGEGLETDWEATLDLSARYNVEFGTGPQVSFTVDVFNVFNSQAVTQRNEVGDFDILGNNPDGTPAAVLADPNYGTVTRYQAPRSVRFGIDILF